MNVETKALIRRRQDRDGRPRTRHFPAGPSVLGRASAGSSSHLLSISIHAGPVLVLGGSSLRHHLVAIRTCPGEDGTSNSCPLRQNDLAPLTSRGY